MMNCELKYDFQRICRICLVENNLLIDLFQPGMGDDVLQVISLCSGLKMSVDDGLPKQICNECLSLANTAYFFRQQCEAADIKLKEYLLRESTSFKKELGIMELNDIGDYFQYDPTTTDSLFPSPRHSLIECEDRQTERSGGVVSYSCHVCHTIHKSCRDLVDHVMSSHSKQHPDVPPLPHTTCEVCSHKSSDEFSYNKHKSTHAELFTVNETISCPFCVELFTKHKSQQKHINSHVASSLYKCDKCECYFIKESRLKKHMKISHVDSRDDRELTMDSDILKTNLCLMDDSYSFLNNELDLSAVDLIPNIDENNLNGSFINQEVDTAEYITEDDANKVLSEVLKCVQPMSPFLSSHTKHKGKGKVNHSEEYIEANDEVVKTEYTEAMRVRTYGESTPVRSSPSKSKMKKQRRARPAALPIFHCSQCTKSFTRLRPLERHEAWHRGEKNVLCSECGKGFYKKSELKKHVQINHEVNYPKDIFCCPVCPEKFSQLNYLNCHKKKHKENKILEKREENQAHLCTICGKALSSNSNLHVHMRRHTRTMTYVCKICGRGYPRNTELQLHLRRHTGERPFQCDVCQMSFVRLDALRIHSRTHTGERPYKCPKCSRTFKQSGDLGFHVRKVHSKTWRPPPPHTTETNKSTTQDIITALINSKQLKVTLQKNSLVDDLVKYVVKNESPSVDPAVDTGEDVLSNVSVGVMDVLYEEAGPSPLSDGLLPAAEEELFPDSSPCTT